MKTVLVRAAVWLVIAAAFVATGCGGGGGGSNPPPPPPPELRVLSTVPTDAASGVSVGSVISVTFSEAITSLPGFSVANGSGLVTGNVSIAGATARFAPSAPLVNGTFYAAAVAGATGSSGSTLATVFSWGFTTVSAPAPAPTITLSVPVLAPNATQGGANPASQSVTITNGGGATLGGLSLGAILYGPGATGWLGTPILNSSSAPATLTVQALTGNLATGTYTAAIPILAASASNSPQSLAVTFSVEAPAASIVLAPQSRAFTATRGGTNPASQSITITNGAGGTLSGLSVGTVSYGAGGAGWLQTPTLDTTTAPATLTVQPLTGSLTVGTYSATIPLLSTAAGNSPQTLTVTFAVTAPVLPTIALSATSRTYTATQGAANPASQSITITTGGAGTLGDLSVGTIAYGAGAHAWLQASLSSSTAPATLTVQPLTGSLTAGTYTATVSVQSSLASNSPQTLSVTFTVAAAPPSILLSATSLTYSAAQGSANPASKAILITNGGGGSLSNLSVGPIIYSAGASAWLQATLNTTAAPATLTVQPLTGSLTAGTYTATAPIQSTASGNSPQSLKVTFTVEAPLPSIILSASSRNYTAVQGGANPASQAITITNGGGGTLGGLSTGPITYGPGTSGWLQTPRLNTSTAPATLTVQPLIGTLSAGTYTATIPVQSTVATNSPQTLSVTFTVAAPPPSIVLSATNRTYTATQGGGNPASQTISITNGGSGTLSGLSVGAITYGAGAGAWLQATLNTTVAPATLTVQALTGSLTAGTYNATIPVQSSVASNSPQTLGVTFTVAVPPGTMALSTVALTFVATQGGVNASTQSVSVTNVGTGTLSGLNVGPIAYGPGPTGWLQTPTLNSTVAPATLAVQPVTGTLTPGTYTATISVQSTAASNSPQNILVTLNVFSLAQQVTIGGLAEFESVPNDVTRNGALNYAAATFKPIRAATVEIHSANSGVVLASGTTSATGTYSLAIPLAQPVIVSVRAEMKRAAITGGQWDFSVRDNTNLDSLYVLDSASFTPSGATVTQNMRAPSGWGVASYTGPRAAGPFAILDVAYQATQKVLSAAPNSIFPALRIFWSTANVVVVAGDPSQGQIPCTCSGFDSSKGGQYIYLRGKADVNTDEYDSHVVAHEWGHYLQKAFSRDDSVGGGHSLGERVDMRVAFSEGWGSAWSGMALGSPVYADSADVGQSGGFTFDISQSPTANWGWFSEQSVQYLLWNFHADSAIGFTPIFNVLSGPLKAQWALTSIHSFSHHLKAAVPARAAAIDQLLGGQLIAVQDALGTGETNDGGIALALPIYKAHTAALGVSQNYCVTDAAGTALTGDTNKLGVFTYVLITLANGGARTILATSTNGAAETDPDLLLRRADGSQVFALGTLINSEALTATLPAGTHMVLLNDFRLRSPGTLGTRCFNLSVQ